MTKTDVAVAETVSQLPAHLQQDMEQYAGMGNSQKAEDNVLPFLGIIQKGSPQVNKQEPEYIKGAEAGMLLNSATTEIFSGDEGVVVIPCGFQKALVEWIPRADGGGYVATHPFDLELARKMGATKAERGLVLPNGHQLVETSYTFVLMKGVPLVIGASATALGAMRTWMALRNAARLPSGASMPSFAKRYLLRTVYQKNDKGDWYNWKVEDAGFVLDAREYEMAKEFAIGVAKGDVLVGRPDDSLPASSTIEDESIPV